MDGGGGDEEYARLVREQLDALGYNSASIPDSVLREFLADFEQMDIAPADGAPATPLSYPTALSSTEAKGAEPSRSPSMVAHAKQPSVEGTRGRKGAGGARKVPLQGTKPHGKDELPKEAQGGSAPIDASEFEAVLDIDYGDSDAPMMPVPAFDRAHWAALAPKSSSRPATARSSLQSASAIASPRATASRPQSARPSLGSTSMMGGGFGPSCGSGVIFSSSSAIGGYGGTPRQFKSDPVAMHAKRREQWRTDSFLGPAAGKSRTSLTVSSPLPISTVVAPRRRVNTYVVPTSKRRDDLVWQTRLRMRYADPDAGGKPTRARSKTMVPNRFVPATEKRRDDLRWAVRNDMAFIS